MQDDNDHKKKVDIINQQHKASIDNFDKLSYATEELFYKLTKLTKAGFLTEQFTIEFEKQLNEALRRSYIFGQDTVFDAIKESKYSGGNVYQLIIDSDPKLGLPIIPSKEI